MWMSTGTHRAPPRRGGVHVLTYVALLACCLMSVLVLTCYTLHIPLGLTVELIVLKGMGFLGLP